MDTNLLLVLVAGLALGYIQKSTNYVKDVLLGLSGIAVIPIILGVVGLGGYPFLGLSLNTICSAFFGGYVATRVYKGLLK